MKKMKLFLLAAMIFAAGSAFTTVKVTEGPWVLNPEGDGFITEEYAINTLHGSCNSDYAPEKCTYSSSTGAVDPNALDGRYTY